MAAETLWLPRSDCGGHCLPQPGSIPAAGPVRVAGRLAAAFAVLGMGAPVLLLTGGAVRARLVHALARLLLRLLGVRHELRGRAPRRPVLVAANHVSWLDVLLLLAHLPVRLLAKRDVRSWPVVGGLAAAAGTLFVDRDRPRALPVTVRHIAAALRDGSSVALFPEGTTWCGRDSGVFRPAMFQAAIDAGAAVLPVSVRFEAGGELTTVAAFVGDDGLLASLVRVASARELQARVMLHAALHPDAGTDRRALARATHASIAGPPATSARRQRRRANYLLTG